MSLGLEESIPPCFWPRPRPASPRPRPTQTRPLSWPPRGRGEQCLQYPPWPRGDSRAARARPLWAALLARPRTWLQLPAATLPALTRRATRAGPSTSALRDRTEAASSAAGCEADPGDEMTTSTLQVARRGPAGLQRRKEARRGLRAGSRAGGSLLGAARSSPRRRRRLRPFLCSPARS